MSTALIIVDVQHDFVEGGALGVDGGKAVADRIDAHLATHGSNYDLVVASRDWHNPNDDNGGHFDEWPVHCVQGTPGAEFAFSHAVRDDVDVVISKGMGVPAYSAFQGTTARGGSSLAHVLNQHLITDLVVVGIATDYCVKATVLDALNAGFKVTVLSSMVAGVAPDTTKEAVYQMHNNGARFL